MFNADKRKIMPYLGRQNGTTLIVVLVILAAITVAGLSNMQSATLEMRMIASTINRNEAFALAEAGLARAEEQLSARVNTIDDLYTDMCDNEAGPCFNGACTDGYCFAGDFDRGVDRYSCEVSPDAAGSERKLFWRDETIWRGSNTTRNLTVGSGASEMKYIVEFLCFVDNSGNFGPTALNDGDPFFRVTVMLETDAVRGPIMLQSNYVVKI